MNVDSYAFGNQTLGNHGKPWKTMENLNCNEQLRKSMATIE
jgi:hypothetical protein